MWPELLEWWTEALAGGRPGQRFWYVVTVLALAVLGVSGYVQHHLGVAAFLPCAALLLLGAASARLLNKGREALWRAACLGLGDRRQRPERPVEAWLLSPSARSLWDLACAVDAVRRGEPARAADLTPRVERARLRPEEARLLDAARAIVALALGDRDRAAHIGLAALPTGSGELDAHLGRLVVASAWRSPARLKAVDRAWHDKGLSAALGTPLGRIASLVRLRVAPEDADALPATDARAVGDEARALGDDAFAAELEARARARAYR